MGDGEEWGACGVEALPLFTWRRGSGAHKRQVAPLARPPLPRRLLKSFPLINLSIQLSERVKPIVRLSGERFVTLRTARERHHHHHQAHGWRNLSLFSQIKSHKWRRNIFGMPIRSLLLLPSLNNATPNLWQCLTLWVSQKKVEEREGKICEPNNSLRSGCKFITDSRWVSSLIGEPSINSHFFSWAGWKEFHAVHHHAFWMSLNPFTPPSRPHHHLFLY